MIVIRRDGVKIIVAVFRATDRREQVVDGSRGAEGVHIWNIGNSEASV